MSSHDALRLARGIQKSYAEARGTQGCRRAAVARMRERPYGKRDRGTTMLFDTLELSKALQPAFTPDQAEAFVHALSKASADHLATKADIVEMKADIVELRADVVALKASTKAAIAELRSDIALQISALRADTIKWIVSGLAFNFVATAGLIITLIKVFGK